MYVSMICTYTHINIHVNICINTCICTYIYIHTQKYMHIYTISRVCAKQNASKEVCMPQNLRIMCVWERVSECVCLHVCVCARARARARNKQTAPRPPRPPLPPPTHTHTSTLGLFQRNHFILWNFIFVPDTNSEKVNALLHLQYKVTVIWGGGYMHASDLIYLLYKVNALLLPFAI